MPCWSSSKAAATPAAAATREAAQRCRQAGRYQQDLGEALETGMGAASTEEESQNCAMQHLRTPNSPIIFAAQRHPGAHVSTIPESHVTPVPCDHVQIWAIV